MNRKILNDFLDFGCFIGDSTTKKVWCLVSPYQVCSSSNSLTPPYFYLNDFYMSKSSPFFKGEYFYELSYSELLHLILHEKSEKPIINWEIVDKVIYKNQFQSLKYEITNCLLKKGVPFSFLKGNSFINRGEKIYLLKKILENINNNSSYIYGYWNRLEGFIGITPELLFIQKNKNIKTIALAGTAENNTELKKNDLILDNKINKEHYYVIEGINDSLSKFGKITIGKTKVLNLSKISHLKTDINIKIDGNEQFQFEKFLLELHPTAAVGILPKKSDSNWLLQSDAVISNRGYYAAPFGVVFNENNSICICTIRGLQWSNHSLKICAGGGVIHESNFNLEWKEILSKIKAIKFNLGI